MENSGRSAKARLFDKRSFISVPEMMEMLDCSRQALYHRVHRKQIPARKLFGQLVFVPKEIERWLVKKGLVTNVQR